MNIRTDTFEQLTKSSLEISWICSMPGNLRSQISLVLGCLKYQHGSFYNGYATAFAWRKYLHCKSVEGDKEPAWIWWACLFASIARQYNTRSATKAYVETGGLCIGMPQAASWGATGNAWSDDYGSLCACSDSVEQTWEELSEIYAAKKEQGVEVP